MKTWTFIDKTMWPERGPWDSEPDKAVWIDPETGLDCMVLRAKAHWCGYVGVPPMHPAHGKDWELVDVYVHGGLTFSDRCQEGEGDARICHTPEACRPDNVWWLGFDCAHGGDFRPHTDMRGLQIHRDVHLSVYGKPAPVPSWRDRREIYRDFDYVKAQVESLAQQLHWMSVSKREAK